MIIPSGKGVEFRVPPGTGGTVVAEPSVDAYLLSGLLYGIDTLVWVYTALPWTKADPSKTLRAVHGMFDASDCVRSMSKMATNPVATAHDAGEVFRTAAELATGCLGEAWGIAYGLGGAVGSFVLGVLLWLVDGVKLVFAGIGAALDTAIFFNGYQIAITSAGVTANVHITNCAADAVNHETRPTQLQSIGCGQFGALRSLTWTAWTADHADGKGTALIGSCDPDCATGRVTSYPVIVHADRPIGFPCGTFYTRFIVTFAASAPPGLERYKGMPAEIYEPYDPVC